MNGLMTNFGAALCLDRKRIFEAAKWGGSMMIRYRPESRANLFLVLSLRELSWNIPGFIIQEQGAKAVPLARPLWRCIRISCLITQKQSTPSLWCRCCGLIFELLYRSRAETVPVMPPLWLNVLLCRTTLLLLKSIAMLTWFIDLLLLSR